MLPRVIAKLPEIIELLYTFKVLKFAGKETNVSPCQTFFFNNKVLVDSVRKIQFLVDVYVPEGLSLGIKLAADSVAHS